MTHAPADASGAPAPSGARFEAPPAPSAPETRDPRIPARDRVVTRELIDRWAREKPDVPFAVFDDDGETWSWAAFREKILQTALGLQGQGVKQGDHVLVWMPNGRRHLRLFYAINYLGAVYVPINTAYRGGLLEHVVAVSDARLAIVHGTLAERLAEVKTAKLERLVLDGPAPEAAPALPTESWEAALEPEGGTLAPPERAIEPWDPMAIIYTSGTTGPSKGVLTSYLHIYSAAGPEAWPCVEDDDRFLINGPMFHILGMGPLFVTLARGGSIAFLDRFDTATFWDSVRRTGATVVFLLGVMAAFLEKAEARPDDADNPLKRVFMVPLGDGALRFAARFGVEVYTIFNMTEISSPIVSEANPEPPGACGRAREGVEVRLVDENDCEVPDGQVGEMILRSDRPWAMNSGYYNNPEATARAWRNGWFHTGDAFMRDAEGRYFFVDRMKDAIRRRGENISSFEVEQEVTAHPDVAEAAAVAAPSELGEDEVLIAVAPVAGRTVDPAELFEFLRGRLAYFMLPRYIRVLDALPKTPTEKVRKVELRAEGATPDAWDREAAGLRVKSERFDAAGG